MSNPNSTFNPNFNFNPNVTKKCTLCGVEKSLSDYRRQTHNISGFGRKCYCKECDNEIQKMRYKEKRITIIQQVREWQSRNQDKIVLYKEKYKDQVKSKRLLKKQQNEHP